MRVAFGFLGAVFGFANGIASLLLLNSVTGRSADFDSGSEANSIATLVFILAWPVLCAILGALLMVRVPWRKPVWIVAGMPLAAVVMYFGACQIGRLPSDRSMLDNFYRDKPMLEQLKDMSWPSGSEDWLSLSSEGPCVTNIGQSVCGYDFSSSQIATGKELLRKADIGFIRKDGSGNSLAVQMDYRSEARPSLSGGSAKKGYAFMASTPDKIASRLDPLSNYDGGNDPMIKYRHITGDWYLFYEYDPPVWP